MSYYGKLYWLQRATAMLGSCPVPGDDTIQDGMRNAILLSSLDRAMADVLLMLRMVQPEANLWAGDEDDPLRMGLPLAREWDKLMEWVR